MAAKNKNGTKNGTKNGGHLEKLREPLLLNVSLRIGAWRELFNDQAGMMIISDALNECVVNNIFTLAGYLITARRVFLVIYPKGPDAESMLFAFYDTVRRAVRHHADGSKYAGQQTSQQRDRMLMDELLKHPFHRQYCINDHLERLVTGRRVNLPYHSPHLDVLKDKVRRAVFCSAIEYRGGEGPVIIEKLRKILH